MIDVQATRSFIQRRYDGNGRFRFSPSCETANLYSTCFGILVLDLLDELGSWSRDARDALVATLRGYQDAKTGLFRDETLAPTLGAKHDQTYVEHQQTDFALMALQALGAEPAHGFAFLRDFLGGAPGPWLDGLDWRDPWLESNRVMFVLNFLLWEAERGNRMARVRVDQVLNWLDANQDPKTGLWNLGHPVSLVNQMAGAYHFLFFYTYVDRRPNHLERVIDACLRIQDHDGLFTYAGGGGSCEDLDAVDLLCRCWLATEHRTREVRSALHRAHRGLVATRNPDGGFCWAKREEVSPSKVLRMVRPSLLRVSWSEFRDNARDKWSNQKAVLRKPQSLSWAYSGIEPMRIPLSASDLWSTWFRLLAMAMIEETFPEIAGGRSSPWKMRKKPGLGFFRSITTNARACT